jgi:ABC-type multidrug transport system ATPase subunit
MQGQIDYFSTSGQLETLTLEKGRVRWKGGVFEWLPARATWLLSVEASLPVELNGRSFAAGSSVLLTHLDAIRLGPTRGRFLLRPECPIFHGKPCREVSLGARRLHLGRVAGDVQPETDVDLWQLDAEDRMISLLHVEILPQREGWLIRDYSAKGTYLNGAPFQQKLLVPGDRFTLSTYAFEFTGASIVWVDPVFGARVEGHDLSLTVPQQGKRRAILRSVSLEIHAGEFLGILGGSGQGKSTLMNVLVGLQRPHQGRVTLDGESIEQKLSTGSSVGFVPQDNLVHEELTVQEALLLTARLRLDAAPHDLLALVRGTLRKLGLENQASQSIQSLSGGQRKRVNIATELLRRPAVLFLDEPTSGLDAENQESVSETLQSLRLTGQTVVCTTHSLSKAFLFDRIAFIHEGQLLFLGTLDEAREHFLGIEESSAPDTSNAHGSLARLERIYKLLSQPGHGDLWLEKFRHSRFYPLCEEACPPPRRVVEQPLLKPRPGFLKSLLVLIETQASILFSDRWNWQSILLQALGIGLLAGIVGLHDAEFRFFACLIATLWFGCNNASQAVVRDLPIFRRERIAGLGLHVYGLSKTLFLSLLAWVQVLLLLIAQALPVLALAQDGHPAHAILPGTLSGLAMFGSAFLLTGLVGVQLGLAISATARTATQASLWVPLALIPQILFSGFVVTQPEMSAVARSISRWVPSSYAQRLVDLALVSEQRVPLMTDETEVPLFFWTDFAKDASGRWEITPGTNAERLKPKRTSGQQREDPRGRPSNDRRYREIDEYNTAWQNTLVVAERLGTHSPTKHSQGQDYVTQRADVLDGVTAGVLHESVSKAKPIGLELLVWIIAFYLITLVGLLRSQPATKLPRWLLRWADACLRPSDK